jgi:hypothetical protein
LLSVNNAFEMELVCVGNIITVDLYLGVIINDAIDEVIAAAMPT